MFSAVCISMVSSTDLAKRGSPSNLSRQDPAKVEVTQPASPLTEWKHAGGLADSDLLDAVRERFPSVGHNDVCIVDLSNKEPSTKKVLKTVRRSPTAFFIDSDSEGSVFSPDSLMRTETLLVWCHRRPRVARRVVLFCVPRVAWPQRVVSTLVCRPSSSRRFCCALSRCLRCVARVKKDTLPTHRRADATRNRFRERLAPLGARWRRSDGPTRAPTRRQR